jgi:hypothetical protein
MSNPLVWQDAQARIQAVADQHGLPVRWPNEMPPGGSAPYLHAEIHSSGAAQLDLDNSVWVEEGIIGLDLLVPTGTGFDAYNTIRHELGRAFRRGIPTPGLVYTEQSALPGEEGDEAGNWYRLTRVISWTFQEQT